MIPAACPAFLLPSAVGYFDRCNSVTMPEERGAGSSLSERPQMSIARILILGIVVMFAVATAAFRPVYAAEPCCNFVGGKYINLKTGKEVTPPKGVHAPRPAIGGSKPAEPCCNLRMGGGGGGHK
jgi:hypothetical protein